MSMMEHLMCLTLLWSALVVGASAQSRPNIIYLFVDDLGYNDVGYHDSSIHTPTITRLATEGIIIENNYVAPVCGPSRAALLTGRYTHHVGYQNGNGISITSPTCLTMENPILPEALKALGYNTYMLGKWGQLGFCKKECTPTYRGFDKYYGFYSGQDHYTHERDGVYDFHDGLDADIPVDGQYSGEALRTRAREYIFSHMNANNTKDNPFFMYFSFHNVHSPLQAPEEYINMYLDEPDIDRRLIKAMITFTDDTIRYLVEDLQQYNIYDNTIIMFSSDNGGANFMSSNSPLRGCKTTLWEGGVRVPGFVHSPLLKASADSVSYGLFHQTDWYPTIVALAGGAVPEYVDGHDQTDMIINGGASARSVVPILYNNYNPPTMGRSAIRVGKWKLIKGFAGKWDGYDSILTGPDALHLVYDEQSDADALAIYAMNAEDDVFLFDLEIDPTESTNLAEAYPLVVEDLEKSLEEMRDTTVAMDPLFLVSCPRANPELGGVLSTGWC